MSIFNLQSWWGRGAFGLVLIAAVALVVANRQRLFGRDPVPNSPDLATYWYCPKCASGFSMTPREYEQSLRFQPVAGSGDKRQRPVITRATVRCSVCGTDSVSARKCMKDGTIYDPMPTDGSVGKCPTCGSTAGSQ